METVKVGIREFRDKLATYVLEAEGPLAITRHGDTVGFYVPVRRKRSEEDRVALREAAARWHETMAEVGITEEAAMEEFRQLRRGSQR